MNNPFREFEHMLDILIADVDRLTESEIDDQSNRRMFARSVFALIEGAVYRMKQICLSNEPESHYAFSAGELALLREESYELDDKGRVVVRPSNLQMQKNIKFAFEAFSKYYGSDFKLKIDDLGWQSFLQAIKLRNRLMHPKFASDLHVTDPELKITKSTNDWFQRNVHLALDRAATILERETNESKEAIKIFEDAKEQLESLFATKVKPLEQIDTQDSKDDI